MPFTSLIISPGIYELALSDDKEFLLLIESHNLIAVIPVFKLAQNEAEVQRIQQEKGNEISAGTVHKKMEIDKIKEIQPSTSFYCYITCSSY